ncbi:class I SAM-dependent methyltransferase [Ectobacillus ponti]|uniref:SAM-dependent methyltransferase n=1 Tax=Ectobacillus ponti TaxID=2961894 RepID=A0AA42BMY9_9BACI|nr:SAM-dependent methyltransferase [Ectobacillus ponti]MCP8967122.1 SAM-dependent methyltransferase [Ectobacillus ponti]
MKQLICRLIDESETKSIPYSVYMNTVLYHPEQGYYMKEREKVGREGDFLTSSTVSAAFARQFARLFIRLVEDGIVPAAVCEIGGGTGAFARQLLQEWRSRSPHTFAGLQYVMVETSPYHRKLQQERLAEFVCVSQYQDFSEVPVPFTGLIFSNELFDALPVEVIEMRGGMVYEIHVSHVDDTLIEVQRPLQNAAVEAYLKQTGLQLAEGQRYEVPLAANAYMRQLGSLLERGLLITVDYGYTAEEWRQPVHRDGSLRGYYRHTLVHNPLAHPGDMDLTAHVHWDDLQAAGEEGGLQSVLQLKQRHFLLASGILEQLVEHHDPNPFSEKSRQNRAVRAMIMDGGMSDSFEVLLQQKGLDLKVETYFDLSFLPV